MKYLITVLSLLFFTSCHDSSEKYLIVSKVEKSGYYTSGKYKVSISSFPADLELFTDSLYSVGDTLQ
jgi:hypothetical protein